MTSDKKVVEPESEKKCMTKKRAIVKFDCQPPETCFTCPLPDCNNSRLATKRETAFTKKGLEKDYIETDCNSRQYTINMPYCGKSNLLL